MDGQGENSIPAAQSPSKVYKPGDLIEVDVDGYADPFPFRVGLLAYRKLMRSGRKELATQVGNFLKASSQDWERLAPLLDEGSASFDMTLEDKLTEGVMEAIGLLRETTVKKRSPSPI